LRDRSIRFESLSAVNVERRQRAAFFDWALRGLASSRAHASLRSAFVEVWIVVVALRVTASSCALRRFAPFSVNTDSVFPLFTDFNFPLFGADFSLEADGSDLHPVLHAV